MARKPSKTEQMDLDETDRRILLELKADSRRSYRELAKAIGLSPAAVIERTRRLESAGVIRGYTANFDYSKLGFEFMAIVEVRISGDDLLTVEKRISQMPHVGAVWDTTGEYDALVILMCKSRSELSATVKKILAMEEVVRTNTNVVLNVVSRLTEFGEV
ncbi:MAG: Lrp/AsnC family transcriptional regulator [Candidatus Micrarchaeota archaeon]